MLSIAWGTAIRQLAAGLGVEVDEIRDSVEQEPAPEDFDVAVGHIAKGTVAALRFQIEGMVDGQARRSSSSTSRGCARDLRPDWAQPAQPGGSYRVEITGEPSYVVDICPTSRNGDHNYAAILAAAARIVNAIPDVVAAAPGIRTTLDLPLVTGGGTVPGRVIRCRLTPRHSSRTVVPLVDGLDRRAVRQCLHQRDAAAPGAGCGVDLALTPHAPVGDARPSASPARSS